MTPLLSIGMPVFNGELFIIEALDSLLAQSFSDFELIISDNASSDGTPQICHEYALRDNRIRYFRQNTNVGALANFQFVLNQAKCDYFMWAACDDRWDPHWVGLILNDIIKLDNVAGFGELVHIDSSSNLVSHRANFASFEYKGISIYKKIKFFLSYEGNGKANLFYAIYPRKVLVNVNLQKFKDDYIVIFNLLNNVSFFSTCGVKLHKRIHSKCCGNLQNNDVNIFTLKKFYGVFLSDFKIIYKYLHNSSFKDKFAISFFIVIKFFQSFYYHFFGFIRLLINKLILNKFKFIAI